MKQTPLYDQHKKLGGKMVDFGGWALPIQYRGIIEEHETVRKAAGLFDVSHMGEFLVLGADAHENLQRLVTNDLDRLQVNQAMYSPMCTPSGGTVDDLLIYKRGEKDYMLVVNAANIDADEAWIRSRLTGQAAFQNVSDETAQLAVQGPHAESILQRLTGTPLASIRTYRFLSGVQVAGLPALVSRTGYTGEDGFEIYLAAPDACLLWDRLLESGAKSGLAPVGLGARDTLRFEAALPLYGHELALDITPLEAGLDRFVKLEKPGFVGREALILQKAQGLTRKRAGLEMIDSGVPRSQYPVFSDSRSIGHVTSGSYAPTLKRNVAMALLDIGQTTEGTKVEVRIRDRLLQAQVCGLPFYRRQPA